MYRRFLFLVSLALWALAATLVYATGDLNGMPEKVNDGKPVTIVVSRLGKMTDAFDIASKAEVAVARAFMARYPNITLKPFSFLTVPGGGGSSFFADTQTLMSMAAGIAPDVLTTNFRQSDTFIRQDFLLNLDPYIEEWRSTPAGEQEFRETYLLKDKQQRSALTDVAHRFGPDRGEKHWYAVPPQTLVLVLSRMKNQLTAAGVNAEVPPKTWNEFYDQAIKVCDPRPDKDLWAYSLSSSWFLNYMLWSAGSDIIGEVKDKPMEWEAKYNDDAAVRAFQYAWVLQRGPWAICTGTRNGKPCETHFSLLNALLGLAPDAKIDFSKALDFTKIHNPVPESLTATCPECGARLKAKDLDKKHMLFYGVCTNDMTKYNQNKVVFQIIYMGDMSLVRGTVDPNVTGISRVPADPKTGKCYAEVNSTMYAINGSLKNETPQNRAKVEAAWTYIRFRSSEEARRIMTKVYVEGGYARYMNPIWLKKFGYHAYLGAVDKSWEKTFLDALSDGRPEPYGKNAQQIYNEMDNAWGQIRLLNSPDPVVIKDILNKNVARTNERLFGTLTPQEKRKRDIVAMIVVLVTLCLFVMLFRYTMAAYGHALSSDNLRTRAAMRQVIIAWLIMLPALAAVCIFQYLPLARGSMIAFQDYQILRGGTFIGLSNFGQVLFTEQFWKSLGHSMHFAAIALGLGFVAPVILALLLHEIPRGSLFFRIIFYLPHVTSGIVVMLLWMQLYNPQATGLLNQLLAFFGIPAQEFLQDPDKAMLWVVLPSVWAGMGSGCIIYLAALQQIPTDYYEAADVDGAGIFTKLKNITLPFLKPLLIINFVGAFVNAMRSFEPILIMTQGGPAETTQVLGLTIWQSSFMYLQYGYATAMGWMLATLLIGFTMFQLRYLSKVQFRLAKSD